MSKIIKGLALITVIVFCILVMPGVVDRTHSNIVQANDAGWSEEGSEESAAAFTIVEIVPYKGLSEIGYLVGGEEPIDKELLTWGFAVGCFDFLGGAITPYRSYTEKPMPTDDPDSNWRPVMINDLQNGYFQPKSNRDGGRYTMSTTTYYQRVSDGSGSYNAVLGNMVNVLDAWNPLHQRNVNAYFVYGSPSGVPLQSATQGYEPYSVTEMPERNGDYDYDPETERFLLNKGAGKYDVIFKSIGYATNAYHMTADYELLEDCSGTYSFSINYSFVGANNGNYNRVTGTQFIYNRWNGNYEWVQDEAALSKPRNYYNEGGRIWVQGQKVVLPYQYNYNVEIVNNEWFKRMTLGIPSSEVNSYKVDVITILPDDLNRPENQHYIEEADLFYINDSTNHNREYLNLYENYSFEGKNLQNNQRYNAIQATVNFADHDISWENTVAIFQRVAGIGCRKAAVVMDNTFYFKAINGSGHYSRLVEQVRVSYGNNSNGTMCNMAKLYLMLVQRNMIDFYNAFMNPLVSEDLITEQVTTDNVSGTTGRFKRPDSDKASVPIPKEEVYWNENTFLPYGLNANGEMVRYSTNSFAEMGIYNPWIPASVDLTNNVLTLDGRDIFTSKFDNPFSVPSDSQEQVVVHLSSKNQNGNLVTSYTLGDVTNVITNNGNGYDNIGGVAYPEGSSVEGPPAQNPEDSSGESGDSGIRFYKRVLNIQPTADFTESEAQIRHILDDYFVQIINMTSIQFNSSTEDINSRYDMIFMGSGAGRFNYNRSVTDFNDNSLDGYIYSYYGDSMTINDSKKTKDAYISNDITAQKRRELEGYLDAGYPIVLDVKLYNMTGIKNGAILRDFINQARYDTNRTNFLNYANYTSSNITTRRTFEARLRSALNVVRPVIETLQPIITDSSAVKYVYADPNTNQLTIKFMMLPKGIIPSPYRYDANLYIDVNGDSIFEERERVNVVSNDGSSWEGMRESFFKTYTYQYDMTGLNGVYQWKVVIRRQDNNEIRGNITGYAANSNKETLYILQITENSFSLNLENKVNDSASLIYEYASANALNDYNLVFETLTVAEYQNLFTAANPYSTATSATTNRLSKYHLLILDNPYTAINSANGAVLNIKDEINKGLGILFTKNALGYTNQASYYNTDRYSFLNSYTYNYINRYAVEKTGSKLQYYIFSGLGSYSILSKDQAYETTYITKANEGSITRYPYQINDAIPIDKNFYSNDVTIDYNLLANQRLIGWYCLSDTKSPMVREAGLASGSSSELYQGIYSSSPNDVKNNYYLFSNGGCFYMGINLASADKPGNGNEIKLLVNAMIATYKATNRVVETLPRIEVTDPAPVLEEGFKTITVTQEDIVGTEFELTFEISESLSKMDLTIALSDSDPGDDWPKTIYKNGLPIAIDNTNKVVEVGTYQLKIPMTELAGEHILTLTVTNTEGKSGTEEVRIKLSQPPIVTIVDPAVIPSVTTPIIYTDIDFNALDAGESYLEAQELQVIFRVENAMTDVIMKITSGGMDISDGTPSGVYVRQMLSMETEGPDILDLSRPQPIGLYAMYLPMELMEGLSSRDITITATDASGIYGETTVTLLRRSLFPLD